MYLSAPDLAGLPSQRFRDARVKRRRRPRPRRWREEVARALRKLGTAPRAERFALRAAGVLAAVLLFSAADFAYHVVEKPAEMLLPVSGLLKKTPAMTWRQYAPLFRQYSTAAIAPELLAALAQVEGAGNPLALTYWRWQWSWNPFALYGPASSAVGMYQMTDATFAQARRYCIRDHLVVEDGCGWNGLYSRILPSDAVELAAASLDRGIAAVLPPRRAARTSPLHKEELAALLHLCGAGPARDFARRGFRLDFGERCGDHDAALYLSQVRALERQFRRLAAEP